MRKNRHSYARMAIVTTTVATLICHCPSPAYAEESPMVPSDTTENFIINDDSSSGGMDGLPVPALYIWLGLSGIALIAVFISLAQDYREGRTDEHDTEKEDEKSVEPPTKSSSSNE